MVLQMWKGILDSEKAYVTFPTTLAKVQTEMRGLEEFGKSYGVVRSVSGEGPAQFLNGRVQVDDLNAEAGIQNLNRLAELIDNMSSEKLELLSGALALERAANLGDVLRVADSLEQYELFPQIKTDEDLRHFRLESIGYLPDEYFLMDDYWKDGREIPKGTDIFCTADYGASEGVYLDIYLKWHEDGKPVAKSFITGKTLGENGNDLDWMFLTASAVTKAFHGDHATHARYMKIGGFSGPQSKPSEAGSIGKGGARERAQFSPQAETELSGLCDDAGAVVHLSQQEQKVIIEALVEQRERQEQAMSQTE